MIYVICHYVSSYVKLNGLAVVVQSALGTGGPKVTGGAQQNVRNWDTGLCGCCDDMGVCKFILSSISIDFMLNI